MNIKTFEKATYYLYTGMVILEKETQKQLWFKVDGEDVDFSYGCGFLKIGCSCEFCGKKGIARGSLCSRKIACILYLGSKHRQKELKRGRKE